MVLETLLAKPHAEEEADTSVLLFESVLVSTDGGT